MKLKNFAALLLSVSAASQCAAKVTEIDDIWDIPYNRRPMVVEAYATWCAPCKVYGPIVERLSREYEGKVDFYKINIENPDAADFIDRYEVNSVPLTVFLWDPEGDATVRHSVERGLMSYDELKHYVDETLGKQYRQSAYQAPSSLGWSSGTSPDGFMADADYIPAMAPFEGEWQGEENGYESRLWFLREGNEFQGVGGVLDPRRFSLVNTVYWVALGFGWDDEKDTLFISDVLPSAPASPFSRIDDGTFRLRYFKVAGGKILMEVEEYTVANGHLSPSPSRVYTTEYSRCD